MQESIEPRSTQIQKISLKKYIGIGIVMSYVLGFAFNSLLDLFKTPSSYYMIGSVASVIAASFLAGHCFVGDQKRASTIEENARYSFHFLLWGVLIPFVLLVILLISGTYFFYHIAGTFELLPQQMFTGMMPIVLVFCLILLAILMGFCYMAIRWSFSWYTRRRAVEI